MDAYAKFAELAENEKCGMDYRVRSRIKRGLWAVVAPHGGGIEPGTSEVAEVIAANDFTFYAFEGRKRRCNCRLHIIGTRFDEPKALSIVFASEKAIKIHGEGIRKAMVFLGGRDVAALERLRASLGHRGFRVRSHPNPRLHGADQTNICNRCRSSAGVQVELSSGLRRSCFRSLSLHGRRSRTQRFAELVAAIREALHEGAV